MFSFIRSFINLMEIENARKEVIQSFLGYLKKYVLLAESCLTIQDH